MSPSDSKADELYLSLDDISTQWGTLHDNVQFVMRYGPAIQRYLERLLRSTQDAEEVAQIFLLRVVEKGFTKVDRSAGKFRYYLKVSVRNAALSYLRKQTRHEAVQRLDEVLHQPASAPDQDWRNDYRRCILDGAWRTVWQHQQKTPGNWHFTILTAAAEHPEADSQTLATMVNAKTGQSLNVVAFRKQLSRARHLFARAVVQEVVQTLDLPQRQQIEEELTELGLMQYVAEFLPPRT